jgi:hypothetical protein
LSSIAAAALVTGAFIAATAGTAAAACSVGVGIGINYSVFEGGGPLAPTLVARIGDTVTYTTTITETPSTCGFTNGTVTLTFPDGSTTTLASGLSLAAGTSTALGPTTPFTVKQADLGTHGADPGTLIVSVHVSAKAFTQGDVSATTVRETPVIHPETTLTKTPSCTGCPTPNAPASVLFTFAEHNSSSDPQEALDLANALGSPNADSISQVSVSDSDAGCTPAPPTFMGGDTNSNGLLDPGETWTFTCTRAFDTAGTFPDTAKATGNAGDGREAGTPASQGAPADETANASVTVQKRPVTVTTKLSESTVSIGATVTDQATLVGASSDATGTVHYAVYSDNECSNLVKDLGTKDVTDGTVDQSDPFTPTSTANTWYQPTYSGDNNNAGPVSSDCTTEPLKTNENQPSIGTKLSATGTVDVGTSVTDQATITGATSDAGGTVKYAVYSDNTCQTLVKDLGTKDVTNGTVGPSDAFVPTDAGNLFFQATYSGDDNNAGPISSDCKSEPLTVQVSSVTTLGSTVPPTTTPPTTVAKQATLPFTGSPAVMEIFFALIALATGGALIEGARRRKKATS